MKASRRRLWVVYLVELEDCSAFLLSMGALGASSLLPLAVRFEKGTPFLFILLCLRYVFSTIDDSSGTIQYCLTLKAIV